MHYEIIMKIHINFLLYSGSAPIEIDGVGKCIPAVEFVSFVTKKTRQGSQSTINDLLRGKCASDVAEILCRKAVVPGYMDPTYVITYTECMELMPFLPRHSVKGIMKQINKKYAQLRAGDQSLHAEIDARAVNNGSEALMARDSLGLPAVVTDVIEPELKKRCLMIELEEREFTLKERFFALKEREDEREFTFKERSFALKEREAKMNREHVIETFNVIKGLSGGAFDSREQQLYKDIMLNSVMPRGQQMITNGDEDITKEITVQGTIVKLGHTMEGNDDGIIGKIMKEEWTIANQDDLLGKVKKYVGGGIHPVNRYFEKDLPMLEKVIDRFYIDKAKKKQSNDKQTKIPFMSTKHTTKHSTQNSI